MATTGKTIFITYQFESGAYSGNTDYGFSSALHCRYITTITTDTLTSKKVGLFFDDDISFNFMAGQGQNDGVGFTATKINALIQVQDGITDEVDTIEPDPSAWRKYDVTDQITNHTVGERIDPTNLVGSTFSVDITSDPGQEYNLNYLNYPTQSQDRSENLSFGEETIFFGTVKTDIKAKVYASDIPIVLPLNEYNASTNPTWNGNEPVYISEIAIYDDQGRQVAKAKLNFPIKKDSNVARSIVLGLDF